MITGAWYEYLRQSCFLGSAVRSWQNAYSNRKFSLVFPKVKNQRDSVPGRDGRLGVNTLSDATYLDEVKAAKKHCGRADSRESLLGADAISSAGGYSV